MEADSGNGGHLRYRVNLSADDSQLIKRCLMALAMRFGDNEVDVDQSVWEPRAYLQSLRYVNTQG